MAPDPERGRLRRALSALDGRARAAAALLDRAAWRQVAALALLCLAMFAPGLDALPVTDRDEARFVQASRQMLQSGDYVDIRFQDAPRWKKPAGIYWLQAASAAAAAKALDVPVERVGMWAWRLPSALGATLATLGLFWALTPLAGRAAAFRAAAMTATALVVVAEAHIAKTDAALLAAIVLTMGAYARALAGGRGAALGMWAALAAGVALKGPIVFIPLVGCMAWLAVAQRSLAPLRAPDWRRGPLLFLALAAPWYALIALRTEGAFFREALLDDLLGKVAQGRESHGAPPGTYLAAFWAIFWPWAALAPAAAAAVRRMRARPEARFLLGWAVPTWLVFELTATKLPHYVMPALPALAGLLALWLTQEARRNAAPARAPGLPHDIVPSARLAADPLRPPRRWTLRAGAALFALVGGALALANIAGPLWLGQAPAPRGAALALAGLAATALGAAALGGGRLAAFGALGAAASALLSAATLSHTLPAARSLFPSALMTQAAAPLARCAAPPPASVTYREPSLVFLTDGAVAFLSHEDAARRLIALPGASVWVEDRARARFDRALAEAAGGAAPALRELARVDAFNPNRGKATTLRLLARADDALWSACLGPAAPASADSPANPDPSRAG
ncbi:ArnT family glycosyltransferase [Oceanicella actignis]|uniref:4-amino-4-deoxy-L-arabinose transferase n=1 Tax=Oceanicella actignis TaxID=1189325 RepID=A0A1M7RXZ5_9RHOB|nr:glycosyltransferase family 39 protein [Oceanicella actignis]SES97979.1 4-amino-4-deoxy-L-arabinose transferase [Oceanicella actignis]SHN51050.1 4-amino-4-deoxy-L-arabinose transferase [Oceanicella actignis]